MRLLISGLVAVLLAYGQSFEVASIKLNVNCDGSGLSRGATVPGQLLLECADLRDLILTAYGIYAGNSEGDPIASRVQVTGGPNWIDSDRFDFAAVAPGNPIRDVMLGPMLRSLLEQRFGLKVHRETKDGPIFKLTVARSGFKVKPSADGSCAPPNPSRTAEAPGSPLPMCGSTSVHADGTVDFWGITMMDLSARLGTVLDREVVDTTGLTERYDIHLQVNPRT